MLNQKFEIRSYSWSKDSSFKLPSWSKKQDWLSGFQNLWQPEGKPREIISWIEFQNYLETKSGNQTYREVFFIRYNSTYEGRLIWALICETFDLEYPLLTPDERPINGSKDHAYPIVAFVIDSKINTNDLSNLTIMIPHWESYGFLRLCLWSIGKYYSQSGVKILVLDDFSKQETFDKVEKLCFDQGVDLIRIERENRKTVADVGRLLDLGLNYVGTKYVCMLDADTVHTSSETYTKPMKLLNKRSVVSVGLDTGLGQSYHSDGIWQRLHLYPHDVSYPLNQTITNNLFRVMRTADALAVSRTAEFSRQVENRKIRDQLGRGLRKISNVIGNERLIQLTRKMLDSPLANSQYPKMPPTGDNGVSANYWMEKNQMGLKVNIPLVSYGLMTPSDGVCFQNISNSLIHIALSTRALSEERREINEAGHEFYDAVRDILKAEIDEPILFKDIEYMANKHKIV